MAISTLTIPDLNDLLQGLAGSTAGAAAGAAGGPLAGLIAPTAGASAAAGVGGLSGLAGTVEPGVGIGGLASLAGASASVTGSVLSAIFQALDARDQAQLAREISRGLRLEAIQGLQELTGLIEVPGKGGIVGGPPLPAISTAQRLLRSPRTYSDQEIRHMQAARRLLNPRLRSLTGPATGASLARALPAPSNIWETVVAPRIEAEAANRALRQRAAAAASQFRNLRFRIGSTGYVK